jgi:hypothetical protein
MRSDLSAFCARGPGGVGDLIKASDTPDGPRPLVSHLLQAAAGRVRTRRYWRRRVQHCAQPHGRPVGGGRGKRGVRWMACVVTGCRERSPQPAWAKRFDLASGDGGRSEDPPRSPRDRSHGSRTMIRATHRPRRCCCCTRGSNRRLVSTACCRRCHRHSVHSRWTSAAMAMLTSRPRDMPC